MTPTTLYVLALSVLLLRQTAAATHIRCGALPIIQDCSFGWNCRNKDPGFTCTADCNKGYGGSPAAPPATCQPTGRWRLDGSTCQRLCTGSPVVEIAGATWPASCSSSIPSGEWCTGVCSAAMEGNPKVQCFLGKWSAASPTRGGCTTVCVDKPTPLENGQWPDSCNKTEVGAACTAECAPGFKRAGSPTVTCQADGTWTSPANPDKCEKEGAPELGDGGGGAALPVDLAVAVTATACGQDNRAGNIASVTFDITSVANPQEFPEVTLVVTYPASVTGASLSCTTVVELNMELVIPCGDQATARPAICFIGNITDLVDPAMTAEQVVATCTFSYTIPQIVVEGSNSIEGRLQYMPFLTNSTISDYLENNNASTCAA